jgi:hypothetical protein
LRTARARLAYGVSRKGAAAAEIGRSVELTVDLEKSTVSAGSLSFPATIKPAGRDALVKGEWDPIALRRSFASRSA